MSGEILREPSMIWRERNVMAVVMRANDLVIQAWCDLILRLKMAIIPRRSVIRVAKERMRNPIMPEVPPLAVKLRATPVGKTVVMMLRA